MKAVYICQHHFISFSDHKTEVGKQFQGRIVIVMGAAIKVNFIGDRDLVEQTRNSIAFSRFVFLTERFVDMPVEPPVPTTS